MAPKLAHLAARRNRKYKRDRNGRFATTSSSGPADAAGQHRASRDRPAPKPPAKADVRAAEKKLRGIFGDRLHVRDQDDPIVQKNLVDLASLPDAHLQRMNRHMQGKATGGVYMAARRIVSDIPPQPELRAEIGAVPNIVQAVGLAAYPPRALIVGIGRPLMSATAKHEGGHMLDATLRFPSTNPQLPFRPAVERAQKARRLHKYFLTPGGRGLREAFAESYAIWNEHRDSPDRALRIAEGLYMPTRDPRDRVEAIRLGTIIGDFMDTLI